MVNVWQKCFIIIYWNKLKKILNLQKFISNYSIKYITIAMEIYTKQKK